ncbi:SMP-30/gluconolactonase/LRE family protein [Nocardia sp. GCM10030253]|uniref:SMP-30/gluconolactonase/LRE family protein n=1 Tax=Nocardia sp. GCM10030253 TaxID=3273404 RepID=UPI0036405040
MSRTIRRRHFSTIATAVALTTVAACGTTTDATESTDHAAARIDTAYELPSDRVYPEGIAVDPRSGDIYVGSYANGAIYRATPGAHRAETFLAEGADGRKTANGLKVDQAGRLWVIDSTMGVAVYDTGSRAMIARFDITGTDPHFVNDLAITPDGTAYLTDSIRGVVYRITVEQLTDTAAHGGRADLTTQFDLNSSIAPHTPGGFTLNGIVSEDAGRYLLIVDMNGGDLYRVATAPNSPDPIRKIAMHGADLKNGDGLEIHGATLWAAQNTTNTITRWKITDDGATATLEHSITDESLRIPTTLVRVGDRTLVVASQFDKGGPMGPGTPTTPFAVLSVDGI